MLASAVRLELSCVVNTLLSNKTKKRLAKNILRCRSSSTSRQAWKDPDYPLLENFLWRLLSVSIQDVNAGIHPFGSFLHSRFISAPTHLLILPAS